MIAARIAARLAAMAAVIAATVTIAFLLVVALPADPARALAGPRATPDTLARIRAHYCLDRAVVIRYGCFVGRIGRGDLGTSLRSQRPVRALVAERAAATAQLAAAALVIELAIALPLAMWCAQRRRRGVELALTVVHATPAFVLGPLLLYLVGYRLGWLPLGGRGDGGLAPLVLPALTLALVALPATVRLVRDELVTALDSDHVRAARARGLPPWRVAWRHALVPTLPTLVAHVGVEAGALLGGAVVVEAVFAWPGLGREAVLAIASLDLPVILGVTLVAALAVTVASAAADALTWWLDPRLGRAPPPR